VQVTDVSKKTDIKKENQTYISLAVKCKLINKRQEQEIVIRLIEHYHRDENYSVINIFRDDGILGDEEIHFLFSVKQHLTTKMLDKRFGELGVSNYFVKSKAVEEALVIQDRLFRTHRQSKKIGDILLDKKEISIADKTAILLTQDRVKDSFLEQAIQDLASSEIEKINLKMRFGAIAVKKGIISIDNLNQALKFQKTRMQAGEKKYLGQIFQELFNMPEKEVLHILKIQKEIEKNRLSLEKALTRYQSEKNTVKRLNELFDVHISNDKMSAAIHKKKDAFEKIDLRYFHNWLKLNGIHYGVCKDELIASFLDDAAPGAEIDIAEGASPTKTRNEVVEFFFDTAPETGKEDSKGGPPLIKKGALLARITPYRLGDPGKNVLGHPIPPAAPKIQPLGCGNGVFRKAFEFFADIDGVPVLFKNRSLFVTPLAHRYSSGTVNGPIETDTKETYLDSILEMTGDILKSGSVNCHGLTLSGNVYGCVNATGGLDIKGCIGKNSREEVGFRTVVQANDNITVKKNMANARIVTSNSLIAHKSDVVSCHICAYREILLLNVRSTQEFPSTLQIGIKSNVKVDAVNRAIGREEGTLRKLQMLDMQDELTEKFQKQIDAQNEFLDRQHVLSYLLNVCSDASLSHIETVEQKIQIYEPEPGAENQVDLPDSEQALKYLDETVADLNIIKPEEHQKWLKEALDDISEMYRAAVDVVERFSSEYNATLEFIMKKVERQQPEIERVKRKIEELLLEKDYIQLNEVSATAGPHAPPAIRVKNLLEKHTIIKGRKSSLIINDNIHGVKVREIRDPSTGEYRIAIEGYYD